MKIQEITSYLESFAPLPYQESYDNAGLIVGDAAAEVTAVLLTLDVTEEVIDEAVETNCNLIVAHHPIIFRGLKKLTGSNYVERTVIKAIRHNIAIYASHTNLDNVAEGVNSHIADLIGLKNKRILAPKNAVLTKIVTFCPADATEKILDALHRSGAGDIGNYSHCSFRVTGTGSFKPNEKANPHIGSKNVTEHVMEERLELIFPSFLQERIVAALKEAHPYEEVAYYATLLTNTNQEVGSGMIGELENEIDQNEFLSLIKKQFSLEMIKYTPFSGKIKSVAVCGGAGSFLLASARRLGAHAFVTSDFKYHEFFDAEGKILIADIGHYESEVFTKNLLHRILNQNFTNIALRLSKANTNPVRYY